jgi:hypothetical protein
MRIRVILIKMLILSQSTMNMKEIIIEEVWDKIMKVMFKNIQKVKNKTSKR